MNDMAVSGLLGLVEGLTEFIPVSSTGHMLLIAHFLGFGATSKTFEIVIQLGPILCLPIYFRSRISIRTGPSPSLMMPSSLAAA